MHNINIEVKSKFSDHDKIRTVLKLKEAEYLGIDFQTETYFDVRNGTLKLREGNIENKLIHESEAVEEKKDILLYNTQKGSSLKKILEKSYGISKVVEKHREIYSIKNVKFYIDFVSSLGNFVGIEAIGKNASHTKEELVAQCRYYVDLLKLKEWEFVQNSYSDAIEKNPEDQISFTEETP